jgi:hypothetical protein
MFATIKWIYSAQMLSLLLLLQLPVSLAAEEPNDSTAPQPYVARAQFTTAVVNREPVDQVMRLDAKANRIFFFTDLRHLQGRTITHRWEFKGETLSVVNFKVGGPRWRVYSAKSLNPGESGRWTVFVLDESGWPLHATIFQHGKEED